MKTRLTIGKSCHPSEPTSDTGVTNNICHPHLSDKSEASMNWIKKQPVEHFDFLALLAGVRAYCQAPCPLSWWLWSPCALCNKSIAP